MTLAENIGLVVEEFTDLPPATIRKVASLKLALVDWQASRTSIRRDQRAACARRAAWPVRWRGPGHPCSSTSHLPDSIRSRRGGSTT